MRILADLEKLARFGVLQRAIELVSPTTSAVHVLLAASAEDRAMSLVRLLGFRTLACGCVIGRYRELATSRELNYVEEKGVNCALHGHRRNHTITPEAVNVSAATIVAARAS
jgi:hypothetical protein